jgi:hypothetical protein
VYQVADDRQQFDHGSAWVTVAFCNDIVALFADAPWTLARGGILSSWRRQMPYSPQG